MHPECRIQLIDALLKSLQTKSCLPLSSLSLQEIVTDTQTMLSGIIPNISSSEELHTDLVSIAITYQRISSLLVTQVPPPPPLPSQDLLTPLTPLVLLLSRDRCH
jgi:hypothetical protein